MPPKPVQWIISAEWKGETAYILGGGPSVKQQNLELLLLGADMKRGPDGTAHHHAPHPWPNAPGNTCWDLQMAQLRLIAAPLAERNIEVINTSADSRIDWWPKRGLEDVV